MGSKEALLVLSPAYPLLMLLSKELRTMASGLVLVPVLLLEQTSQGCLVRSQRADEPALKYSRSEVWIASEYIKAIAWHDDFDGVKRQIGFIAGS
jgi:hypothetical protein